ncbi:MAG: SPOR domain-containing protein, partial [Proteobacteria bacterium]|nr:SPOR domain-containing protein [Pseudomonadota bacterium]
GLRLSVLLLVIAGAGGGGWWVYGANPFASGAGGIPIIRADRGPVKFKPENPGGLVVPDRDKLVYDRMQGNEEIPLVERLLPEAEQPLPPPTKPEAAKLQPAPDAAPAPEGEAVAEEATAPAEAPPESPAASKPRPESPPAAPSRVPTPAEVLAVKPPQAPPPPAEIKKPEPKKAGYKVQLAAIRSPQLAQQEWKRLRSKNTDLLGRLDLSVSRADLGPSKGIFFRLRAGPLPDETAARALCAKLAQRKVGCLVVPPEG